MDNNFNETGTVVARVVLAAGLAVGLAGRVVALCYL